MWLLQRGTQKSLDPGCTEQGLSWDGQAGDGEAGKWPSVEEV